jgi:hypothetical protein
LQELPCLQVMQARHLQLFSDPQYLIQRQSIGPPQRTWYLALLAAARSTFLRSSQPVPDLHTDINTASTIWSYCTTRWVILKAIIFGSSAIYQRSHVLGKRSKYKGNFVPLRHGHQTQNLFSSSFSVGYSMQQGILRRVFPCDFLDRSVFQEVVCPYLHVELARFRVFLTVQIWTSTPRFRSLSYMFSSMIIFLYLSTSKV